MAATRLRRTFHYPSDTDDDDAVEEGMDEQDQETLLSTLSTRDTAATNTYTHLLLVLPLAPIVVYVPRLITASTFLPSLATIASFLASAYALYFLPLPPVKVKVVGAIEVKSGKGKSIARSADGGKMEDGAVAPRRPVPYVSDEMAELLAKYVIPVNGALCLLLALAELWQGRTWSEGVTVGGGLLPGLILTIVMWARRELRVVDLGELEKLRYRTKGS